MTLEKNPKSPSQETTYGIVLAKLQKYCAYQDRCHSEVRTKLLQLKTYGDDLENIISELIQEDYLNEERFACSYVRGKYRMKKWGRDKIVMALKKKGISDYCIRKGLSEIDMEEYNSNLQSLYVKLAEKYTEKNAFLQRQKIYAALRRKGYTNNEIVEVQKAH